MLLVCKPARASPNLQRHCSFLTLETLTFLFLSGSTLDRLLRNDLLLAVLSIICPTRFSLSAVYHQIFVPAINLLCIHLSALCASKKDSNPSPRGNGPIEVSPCRRHAPTSRLRLRLWLILILILTLIMA